jgi:hypothetical protein
MRWRTVFLGLFAVYLLIGPIGRQVFGVRVPMAFQTWKMFAGTARNTCQMSAATMVGGELRPLDIRPATSSKRRWRIQRPQLPVVIRGVCAQAIRTFGPGIDVRVRARCGSRRRWVIESDGSTNACAPASQR